MFLSDLIYIRIMLGCVSEGVDSRGEGITFDTCLLELKQEQPFN